MHILWSLFDILLHKTNWTTHARPSKHLFFPVLIPLPTQHCLVIANTICLELLESYPDYFLWNQETFAVNRAPVLLTLEKASLSKWMLFTRVYLSVGFELGSSF